ncbi:MAG: hypothetical protein K6G23_04295 [Lachnospiraceae bacterium]|nr:hypothetical protein [Lachnospiraceae bacterium]
MPSIVEINGGIPRVMDYAAQRQQEDAKGALQQANMNTQQDREANDQLLTVHENGNTQELQLDLSTGGGGAFYEGDGGKQRKKKDEKEKTPEGKVVMKNPSGGFDMRI